MGGSADVHAEGQQQAERELAAPAGVPAETTPATEATAAGTAAGEAATDAAPATEPATGPDPETAPSAPSATQPALAPVSRRVRWAMVAFFIAFGIPITLVNTTKYQPMPGLRVATKFGMFSAPPKSQPIVVRGLPRRGSRHAEILVDPNKPNDSWLARLRDQRERKWHDNVGRAGGLQQGYLAYRCRVHGNDYRKVQLVALADIGLPEKVILERNCAPLPPDAPKAAE